MSINFEEIRYRYDEVMQQGEMDLVAYGQYILKEDETIDYILHGKGTLEDCFAKQEELYNDNN